MGIASPEEIDLAVTNALGHPMGPFRLMDFTGIDLWNTIRKLVTPKTSPHR
jgi:3-hydroxyacyl-CoA dehydrogenase